VLSRLVNASLVQRTPGGRYHLLPFIRECAAAQQTNHADLLAAHGKFFAQWLAARTPAILRMEAETLHQTAAEMPNLCQMWRWACETRQIEIVMSNAAGLTALCDPFGWLHEGEHLLLAARQMLAPETQPWAVLSLYIGRL
jgi:hypothetical protein